MIRQLLVILAILLLGRTGTPFMPGARYTKGWPILYWFNGHGQLTRDAIRDGRILEATPITRANYQPACWAHMYPKLPRGMSRWPNLTRAEYPDIFKFEDALYRGASNEAHAVYRNGMLGGPREGVWVTDPRDHAQEYRVLYDTGSFRHAYMAMGYRVHCEQDLESPAHQKVIYHSGTPTTGDRLEIMSGIDPAFWNYSTQPDTPFPIPADARMPFTPEVALPVWLADVEDDDNEDDRPDAPTRVWWRDRPFDPGRLDGPAATPDGAIAYWHRGSAGEILPDGSRPPVAEEIRFDAGVWGTYGGHPGNQPPGLNGGAGGRALTDPTTADRAGDFFYQTTSIHFVDQERLILRGWKELFGRVTLRARNRTVKALIEMSRSLPPAIDLVTPTSGAVMRAGEVVIPPTATNPRLTFRVSDNRAPTLKTLRVVSNLGRTKRYPGRLQPTPPDDLAQLPFAAVLDLDLNDIAPTPKTTILTIEVEDDDGNWTRDYVSIVREPGPWDLELDARVSPEPVVVDNSARFLTSVKVNGSRPTTGTWQIRHRLAIGAFEKIANRSRVSPPREFGSDFVFTFEPAFAGSEGTYEVEVTPPGSARAFTARRAFRVRGASRPTLTLQGIEVTPDSVRAGDTYRAEIRFDLAGPAPGEVTKIVWQLWLEGAARQDLPGFEMTVGSGPTVRTRAFTVDPTYVAGEYTLHARATLADGGTVPGVSNPFRVNLSPVRILSVSAQPVGATDIRRGGKLKVNTRYELFGPTARGGVEVTEQHTLTGPLPAVLGNPPQRRAAGAYEYSHEVDIPADAPLGEFQCIASVTARGHAPETKRTAFRIEAGPLRFDSLKAVPAAVRPGETARFVASYRRLGLTAGQTATVLRQGRLTGPGTDVKLDDSKARVATSTPQEWVVWWKVPADQAEGEYRLTLRLSEGGAPPVERSAVVRVSKRASFFLEIVKAWASDGEHAADKNIFRYGDRITLNGRAVIREFDAAAGMRYSFATIGPKGKPVAYLSLAETSGPPPAAVGDRHVWIHRRATLPEMLPGRYATKVTYRVKNRFGDLVTRTRTFEWELEDPMPELDVFVSDSRNGPKRATLLAGEPCVIHLTPRLRGIAARTPGHIEYTMVRGAVSGLPQTDEWRFSPGSTTLNLPRRLAPDQQEGTYRVRVRVILDLFPERENGSYWRYTEHEFRVVQPFKNLRFEIAPDPVEPGKQATVRLRYDVDGLGAGEKRKVQVGWRTGGDWNTGEQTVTNGSRWYQWTPKVGEGSGEFIDVEGFLRCGEIVLQAKARVRVQVLPTMQITSPRNNTTTDQRVITVTGTCADKSVTRGDFWHNGRHEQLAIKNGQWSAKIRLQRGNNRIEARARNRFGERRASASVVANIPQIYLMIRMEWDQLGDVDLWVTDPQGVRTWYSRKKPAPNRWLDVDNRHGYGPEIYTMEERLPGRYVVRLQYFRGNTPTRVTVQVTYPNGEARSGTYRLVKGARNGNEPGSFVEIPVDVR